MLQKISFASCLLIASLAAQATTISYYGYERDATSNFVTGGGLEWLMWNTTNGLSVNEALLKHQVDGWRLASFNDVSAMYNVFKFGYSSWESGGVNSYLSFGTALTPHEMFYELFGSSCDRCTPANGTFEATAMFDGSGRASLVRNYGGPGGVASNEASLVSGTGYGTGYSSSNVGVALVRSGGSTPAPVSLPGSLSLLALGLVSLSLRSRKLNAVNPDGCPA